MAFAFHTMISFQHNSLMFIFLRYRLILIWVNTQGSSSSKYFHGISTTSVAMCPMLMLKPGNNSPKICPGGRGKGKGQHWGRAHAYTSVWNMRMAMGLNIPRLDNILKYEEKIIRSYLLGQNCLFLFKDQGIISQSSITYPSCWVSRDIWVRLVDNVGNFIY